MKPLIPILAVATTSLAVASVQYARQASTQRERADTEMALRQKQEARVAQLERDHARLEREVASLQAAASESPPVAAVASPAPANPPKAGARAAQGEGVWTAIDRNDPNAPPPRGFAPFRGPGFMDSAAGRNYMKSRTKMAMRRLHQDMGSALGLSEEKENQLLDLLADQQSRVNDRFRAAGSNVDPQKPFDFREVQKQNSAEIAALIGQDKMDDWQSYQQSMPDRSQVNMVNQQLTEAGVPGMTENQRSELLAAVTEERRNRPQPTASPGMSPEEQFTQSSEWQAEYEKAVLERAKSVLTAEQYRAYKEFQDFQTEMRKSIPRFAGPTGAPVRFNAVVGDVAVGAGPVTGASMVITAPAVPAPPPE
jgi:hypothetical protein